MIGRVPLGFAMEPLSISLANILPSHNVPQSLAIQKKFKQISTSIKEIGLIEPLIITHVIKKSEHHMLLDGHIRLIVLRELGYVEVPCLVATDDESYTYNNRINRLSTIQEHFMIRRAIDRGVSPQRLADALSVGITHISKRLSLLNGICDEAAELLKDRQFSAHLSAVLRKMKPTRQIECVELMIASNIVTVSYAEAMLVATPIEMLVAGKKPQKLSGVSQEQIGKMEREMAGLQSQYKMVEQSYGRDVLNLVLARGYLAKLLENKAITKALTQKYPEVLAEFELIVKTVALDQ